MQNPHAAGIGLDARGVAAEPCHHLVIQSQLGSRLPGTQPEQLKLASDLAISENFSLAHVDSFPKQPIRAANQDAGDEFIAPYIPQTGGSHHIVACQEGQRINHPSPLHLQFCSPDIRPQAPGHRANGRAVGEQRKAQPCADQSPLHTLEVPAEQAPGICESGSWVWPTDIAGQDA